MCWLFTSGGHQHLLSDYPHVFNCVIDFRVKALSYIELLNHSQHFAALSQLSSHHFFTLLVTPSESHCSRPFGSHETDADILQDQEERLPSKTWSKRTHQRTKSFQPTCSFKRLGRNDTCSCSCTSNFDLWEKGPQKKTPQKDNDNQDFKCLERPCWAWGSMF